MNAHSKKQATATASKATATASKATATASKSTKATATATLKNKAKADREAAAKRVADDKAAAQKALDNYQASVAAKKAAIAAFDDNQTALAKHDLERDSIGITAHGIRIGIVKGAAYMGAIWDSIGALPLEAAIARLNEVYSLLSDDNKEVLRNGVKNRTTPSNAGKRSVWPDLLGKIGRDNKAGSFIDISNQDNSHKAKGGTNSAANKKAGKVETRLSTIDPKEPIVDKLTSQLSTIVKSDPLPTGTDAQNRFMASLIVSALDNLDMKHLVQLVVELNKAIDERVKQAA